MSESDHTGYSAGSLKQSGKAVDQAADDHKKSEFAFINDAKATDTCFGLVPEHSQELAVRYALVYESIKDWLTRHQETLKAAADARIISSKVYEAAE